MAASLQMVATGYSSSFRRCMLIYKLTLDAGQSKLLEEKKLAYKVVEELEKSMTKEMGISFEVRSCRRLLCTKASELWIYTKSAKDVFIHYPLSNLVHGITPKVTWRKLQPY